jgi:hypothetical protein
MPQKHLKCVSRFDGGQYGRTTLHTKGKLTYTISLTNGVSQSDGVLKNSVGNEILHYRQFFVDLPDPIVFTMISP